MPRGRPRKKKKLIKELVAEDWCFVCKDGGDLLICEYRDCLKAYHPHCVEKDDSFLGTESRFECPWHTCNHCSNHASRRCYTCAYAVCSHCINDEEFAGEFGQVKGAYGFCESCLHLALLIEEDKNYDSDGEPVDFKDRNSAEGLFMEYYMILKTCEGFGSEDLHAALERAIAKKKDVQCASGSEELCESDEEDVSDYDCTDSRSKRRKAQKGKKLKRCKTMQTPVRSSKMEFDGWGSKPLIEFLSSIGKNTAEKMSQHDVISIINQYIKDNTLFDPQKKKFVLCDARLQSVFKKQRINKNKVNMLLEPHLAENQDTSEDSESEADSDSDNISPSKNIKKLDVENNKSQKRQIGKAATPHSEFASVSVENMQLVYLNKGLLYELLKQPESFEEKVIGSFVKVKSDKYDYQTRNSHQLKQVKGIKSATVGEYNADTVLLFSTMPTESRIRELSDGNVTEAECEELRQKVLTGLVERPKVVELEQRAKILHKDKIEHWIPKELSRLKNLAHQANEKGWRRELYEYLEKRDRLQTPSEQTRLLDSVPKVIPDMSGLRSNSDVINNGMESEEDSPRSILRCNATTATDGWQKQGTSEELNQTLATDGHMQDSKSTSVHLQVPKENVTLEPDMKSNSKSTSVPLQVPEENVRLEPDMQSDRKSTSVPLQLPKENVKLEPDMQSKQGIRKNHGPSPTGVVDLLSDDEDVNDRKGSSVGIFDDVESSIWCILGPDGETNKCSLSLLKRWSMTTPYAFQFKAWREDQKEGDAVWLHEALDKAFPK